MSKRKPYRFPWSVLTVVACCLVVACVFALPATTRQASPNASSESVVVAAEDGVSSTYATVEPGMPSGSADSPLPLPSESSAVQEGADLLSTGQ